MKEVVIAIICDAKERILITQRSPAVPHGGLWEFPGGKVEPGELPEEALVREIKEEVGLDIFDPTFLIETVHDYQDNSVKLLVFYIRTYQGKARCKENQTALAWVLAHELTDYEFPAANNKIIALIAKVTTDKSLNLI